MSAQEPDHRITQHTVQRTALLSMLALSQEEEQAIGAEFAQIVTFAGALGGGEAQAPLGPQNASPGASLRPDVPGESLDVRQVLRNAKTVAQGRITVPKTFE